MGFRKAWRQLALSVSAKRMFPFGTPPSDLPQKRQLPSSPSYRDNHELSVQISFQTVGSSSISFLSG
jgi:hypothetical protein